MQNILKEKSDSYFDFINATSFLCIPSIGASPPLRFAARWPGPIAGQRGPKAGLSG